MDLFIFESPNNVAPYTLPPCVIPRYMGKVVQRRSKLREHFDAIVYWRLEATIQGMKSFG